MSEHKRILENTIKGIIIAVLCLVLIVGVVLCVRGPKVPGSEPQDAQLSAAPTEPTGAPTDAPQQETEPTKPMSIPQETTPVETEPQSAPTQPNPAVPEATRPQPSQPKPNQPKPTEPQPTVPVPTQPQPTEPAPTEPAPTEPAPTEPEKDIFQVLGQVNSENNVVTEDTSFGQDGISAQIPSGTVLDSGTTELVLTIEKKETSDSGIAMEAGQSLQPLDVHIAGVSPENTAPITICLGKILPNGMNIGNVGLYHVENGTANPMTQVLTTTELDSHNEFYYDPATGDITVAMASFSEIAVVSEPSKWEGKYDYTWYTPEADEYAIANADQLAAFGKIVGGMTEGITQDSFSDKTVKLLADIDLNDAEAKRGSAIFHPIGYYYTDDNNADGTPGDHYSTVFSFEGTFDGQGHTIANFYQNTWEIKGDDPYYDLSVNQYYNDAMGLFGYVVNGSVRNLTVDNFSSDGEFTPTGVIAAYAENSTFENIAITNCNPRVYNTGNGGIVGIAGDSSDTNDRKLTFTNITIDNTNKISALWGSWDVACGGLMGMFRGYSEVTMTNCHVAAQIDVFNDVCGNYQYYWYRYAGMLIGSLRGRNTTDNAGYTVPDMTGITAENCTVHFGTWNDYYYCELVANSLASYTHDHQFSRLDQVDRVDVENMTVTIGGVTSDIPTSGRYNYVVVNGEPSTENATCYHFVDGKVWNHTDAGEETVDVDGDGVKETVLKEDRQHYYLPFNQLFQGDGWGVKHIPIYDDDTPNPFDGVTILGREVADSVTKFESLVANGRSYVADTTVTIGELFTATSAGLAESTKIDADNVQVFVSPVGDNSTASGTYAPNTTDWTQGTLTFSGEGAATISITDYNYCKTTTINVTITEPVSVDKFAVVFEHTDSQLYRVGNKNTVALSSLFAQSKDYNGSIGKVDVTIENINGTASGTYTSNATWTNGTIQFTGTGVVKVTITDNDCCIPTVLYLEVVDAYNRTTASFGDNSVLLNDVSTSSSLSTSGVIYGNGFSVNMENAPISEKNGAVFHLYDGAVLKNLNIVGKEFTTVAMTVNDTNYGVSAVRAWGTVVIENCYISGCRSAVSVTGTELTIKDSVIANGVYANVDFRSGILNLHNVTTINEPHTVNGTTIVGLGIVGNMTASAGRQLNITGTLTQYNWVSKADCENIKATGVSSIFNSVFSDDKYASFRYTYDGTTYANTGILSLCSDFGASAASGVPTNYAGQAASASIGGVSADGYVWAPGQAGTLTADDMKYHGVVCTPVSGNQGTSYIPSGFNYDAAGLTQENGVVQINYESGSSYTLSNETLKKLFTAQKYGQSLSYTITMNGTDYTNTDIVFDATASQTYTITYTVTDNLVYGKDGAVTGETYKIAKDLKVFATVVDKGADAPTFTFYYGTNGSASEGTPHTTQPTNTYTSTIKQVGEAYYIMPNVNATTANAIGSQTVGSETIYYPIVDGINVRSGNSTDYDFTRYYPIFKAVKISDNGTEYSYSGTTEMPATVTWVSATIDTGNGASSLNDGFGLYNNQYLCKIQKKAGDAESGGTSVVQFSYVALDGNTYNYYVGFRFYDEDEGGLCVTGDTLITLADGSQKRVDSLTGDEQLLVWNHTTGSLNSVPVAYIVDHNKEIYQQKIYHLYFSDGSNLKIIGEHVFYDATQNKYATLDENAADYIGHTFIGLSDTNDALTFVQLVNVVTEYEETAIYEVVSYEHLTCFTNGILSASAYMDKLLNIFDIVPETMAYNPEKVQSDIETYGLYTYADFEGLIDKAAFDLYNAKYLKVAVGKGYITWDDILDLIDIYFNVGVTPLQ